MKFQFVLEEEFGESSTILLYQASSWQLVCIMDLQLSTLKGRNLKLLKLTISMAHLHMEQIGRKRNYYQEARPRVLFWLLAHFMIGFFAYGYQKVIFAAFKHILLAQFKPNQLWQFKKSFSNLDCIAYISNLCPRYAIKHGTCAK